VYTHTTRHRHARGIGLLPFFFHKNDVKKRLKIGRASLG
jgi:hypothetical protein